MNSCRLGPDNGGQDVFVHHSVIHKAGFRSLGKSELVEFEPRPSSKGVEATFVCGIGGVKCRGSDRRPISREKFQNKPVQLQQRQPQRRQSQAELQRDRFHGRSGRSTCNITSQPVVDDSAVYTVRPLVDGPALTLNSDNGAAKPHSATSGSVSNFSIRRCRTSLMAVAGTVEYVSLLRSSVMSQLGERNRETPRDCLPWAIQTASPSERERERQSR
ncbi:hypothetical protein C0Q70_16931 [Pomacea canaliculata]|uniref:CSD domain-containing protein n=1 Tax=Pomacea canaliculata TaxID=400727 RepID=A0A2T7NR74_POMCA|nr:hypothetical protein C0Q70_16931 [Pomacea canaliculata]